MAHNTLMLVAQLAATRINVLANRLGCDTDLARTVHDKLAEVLAAMIEAQRNILTAEQVLAGARGTSDEEDAFFDLHHYRTAYYETWLIETVALLDEPVVDDFTHEYLDCRTGRWHHRDGEVPISIPIPAKKLCGLSEMIAQIEDISGVRFSIERVCYSEEEAETAWWAITGNDCRIIFGVKPAGPA